MRIPVEKNLETRELSVEIPDMFLQPSTTSSDKKVANLAEEQLAEKVAEIVQLHTENDALKVEKAELEQAFAQIGQLNAQLAQLAEEPAELSDEQRFEELVQNISSLTEVGKARLAEAIPGLVIQEPAAEEQKQPEEKAETEVAQQVSKPRYRLVIRKTI